MHGLIIAQHIRVIKQAQTACIERLIPAPQTLLGLSVMVSLQQEKRPCANNDSRNRQTGT